MSEDFLILYDLNRHSNISIYKVVALSLLIGFSCLSKLSYSQPTAPAFQQVDLRRSAPPIRTQLPGQATLTLPNDPYREQNLRILQQSRIMSISGQSAGDQQTLNEVMREEIKARDYGKMMSSKAYQDALEQFLQMNPDNFSITKAVYLSESAWYDNNLPYEEFEEHIKGWAAIVKQTLRKEGLNEKDNMAVMYGIQKLYSQSSEYYDTLTRKIYRLPRLQYSFDDYMGDNDWTNMFVTKLLRTKSGQCHSLPLLFLCIAEKLNAKAWLSLSPNHSFIQYFDKKGKRYNFETTNGNLVTQSWLMQSTFINTTALKNNTYLDSSSSRKLYAQCLGDLLVGYVKKIRYDDVSEQITQKIFELDSTNLTALMMQARLYHFMYLAYLEDTNNPPQSDYPKHPQLNEAYQQLQYYRQKIEQTGFQLMPEEAYQAWLKSLKTEKQKQQQKIEQERLQQEIKKLKNIRSTFINKPKQ